MERFQNTPRRYQGFVLGVLFLCFGAFRALGDQDDKTTDPATIIGMTLKEVVTLYGAPQSVHSVRGLEEWQDDVVFTYGDYDFYVYRDRIWQVGLQAAYGVKIGDNRSAITEVFGERVSVFDTYTLYLLPDRPWSITLRFNADPKGKISAIFIYRSDF